MLDEVWLRARRGLVHRLEAAELWPDPADQRSFMREQRTRGERLRDTMLLGVLGPSDFAYLSSESIFRQANGRFRRRLPLVLAFGAELGRGLYGLLHGAGDRGEEVAEASAIFNLGISVFDLISDTDPSQFHDITLLFDATALEHAINDIDASTGIEKSAASATVPEVRLVLKLIAAFFRRLHELSDGDSVRVAWVRGRIATALGIAYDAERQSTQRSSVDTTDWLAVAEAKSAMPFVIISDLARLAALPTRPSSAFLDRVVDHIAATFWLTDDLADVVVDTQSGSLNSLLCKAGCTRSGDRDSDTDYAVLARLLSSTLLDETAGTICGHLVAIRAMLRRKATGGNVLPWQVLTSYTRDWLE